MTSHSHNRLAMLAADIQTAHAEVSRSALAMAERALEAGHMLIEAKAAMPHGGWGTWLAEAVGLSPRSARRYMQLARSGLETATVADIGIRGATERLARCNDTIPLPPLGLYAIAIVLGETCAAVWRCPEQPERFHVAVNSGMEEHSTDCITATDHPVPADLIRATMIQAGFRMGCAPFKTYPVEGRWPEMLRQWALGTVWTMRPTEEEHANTLRAIHALDPDQNAAEDTFVRPPAAAVQA